MSDISKQLLVSNGNITVIVDKLVAEGLALRSTVPGDRRTNIIKLTAKGKAVFVEHAEVHEGWVNELLGGLNADDVDGMIQRLDHLNEQLEGEA